RVGGKRAVHCGPQRRLLGESRACREQQGGRRPRKCMSSHRSLLPLRRCLIEAISQLIAMVWGGTRRRHARQQRKRRLVVNRPRQLGAVESRPATVVPQPAPVAPARPSVREQSPVSRASPPPPPSSPPVPSAASRPPSPSPPASPPPASPPPAATAVAIAHNG